MNEMIRLEGVVYMAHDGQRDLNGVSFAVREGESAEICGASARSRRALARLIAGMEKPGAGSVYVSGLAVHEMDENNAAAFRSKYFGAISGEPAFLEGLTVLENAALPLCIAGTPREKRDRAAKELLKKYGLAHTAHTYTEQLTLFERQRLSLARAVIGKPAVLLFEDIAVNQPEAAFLKMKELISDLKYAGFTMISFSAEPGLFDAVNVITIKNGEIREE